MIQVVVVSILLVLYYNISVESIKLCHVCSLHGTILGKSITVPVVRISDLHLGQNDWSIRARLNGQTQSGT